MNFIDMVWKKVQAHNEKFADLELLPPAVNAQAPVHDGDMAYLHELVDRIMAAGPVGLDVDGGLIEYGIDLFVPPWPEDRAEVALVDWSIQLRDGECEWIGWLEGWTAGAVAA